MQSSTYIEFNVENNDRDPKLGVGSNVKISKYKNVLAKGYAPKKQKFFQLRTVKNIVPATYVTEDLNGEEVL